MNIEDIMHSVAEEFPKILPDATQSVSFQQGAFRTIKDKNGISRGGFYRQAVRNKNNGIVKLFIATVPPVFVGEVNPGANLPSKVRIYPGATEEEIKAMAKNSFTRLQEIAETYYHLSEP